MENKTDNLGTYVELFQGILDRVGDEHVAVGIMHEMSKDRRMCEIRAEKAGRWQSRRQGMQKREQDGAVEGKAAVKKAAEQPVVEVVADEEPATDRQLQYLRVLMQQPLPQALSRVAASRLIDQAKQQQAIAA